MNLLMFEDVACTGIIALIIVSIAACNIFGHWTKHKEIMRRLELGINKPGDEEQP
jgi:hypothetical protein